MFSSRIKFELEMAQRLNSGMILGAGRRPLRWLS
jgi:hypothetical protein